MRPRAWLVSTLTTLVLLLSACGGSTGSGSTTGPTPAGGGGEETSAPEPSTREVVVAVVGPMSGDYAVIGQSYVEGVRLALDKVNAEGGVNGITFKVETYDDRLNATEATNIARQLATRQEVLAVIGHYSSGTVFAAQTIYDQAKIPNFTPSASHPDLTKNGKYTFRLWSTLDQYQYQGGQFSVEQLGHRRQAIIWVNNDWGAGSFEVWKRAVEDHGGEVVVAEQILDGDRDFKAQIDKVRAADIDALVILAYYTEGALVASQARAAGIDVPILGSGTFLEPQFVDIAGQAAEGIIFNTEFHPDKPDPAVQEFVRLFGEAYPDKEIGLYHPTAYEAAIMVVEAVRNVGADREQVREYLVTMENFPGVTGDYTFGEARETFKQNVFVIIEDGKFELYALATEDGHEIVR